MQPFVRGPEKGVGYRLGSSLEDDSSVLALQLRPHADGEFGHRHRVGGALVFDELVVQLGEQPDVFL